MNHRLLVRAFAGLATALLMLGAAQAKGGNGSHLGSSAPYKALAPVGLDTSIFNFDVAGIYSNDPYGSPINEVFNLDVGANAWVTGIGWDVAIYADTPSWLSEMQVAFEDSTQSAGVFLTVGVGDDFPGDGAYSSGGIVDLIGLGLQFQVGADGKLRMEFFEGFDDFENDWDGKLGEWRADGPGHDACGPGADDLCVDAARAGGRRWRRASPPLIWRSRAPSRTSTSSASPPGPVPGGLFHARALVSQTKSPPRIADPRRAASWRPLGDSNPCSHRERVVS